MKKFYTLLAAAAVTVSGMAADIAPVRAELAGSLINGKQMDKVSAIAKPTNKTIKKVAKAPADALTPEQITGAYLFTCTFASQTSGTKEFNWPLEIVAGEGENQYILKGLGQDYWFETANDLTATYSHESEVYEGKTYEYDLLTIKGGQVWSTEDGLDFKIYPGYVTASGAGYDDTSDVDLIYIDGQWKAAYAFGNGQYPGGIAAIAQTEQGATGWVFQEPVFTKYNGKFIGNEAQGSGDDMTFVPYENNIMGKVSSRLGKKTLVVTNIADYGTTITFTVNADNTLSCNNTLIGTFYTDQTHTTTVDLYFTNSNSEGWANPTLTAEVVGTNPTKISLGDALFMVDKQYWYEAWTDPVLEFTEDLGLVLSGLNQVSADDFDMNAPVEYFNLQGVRVNNPEGGIFIMRQGEKVAKVIR